MRKQRPSATKKTIKSTLPELDLVEADDMPVDCSLEKVKTPKPKPSQSGEAHTPGGGLPRQTP